MYLTLAIHLAVGLAGSLAFGSSVAPNVLDSLPQTAAVLAARLAVVLAFAFTFPMMVFLCRMHLRSIILRACAPATAAAAAAAGVPALGSIDELLPASERAPEATPCTDDASVHSGDAAGVPVKTGDAEELVVHDTAGEKDWFRHNLVSGLLVGCSLASAVCFPNIDAIFGLLGGTTSVVLSFVAPALFWEASVGYMYGWQHPSRLFCKALLGFSALIAALSLPGILIDLLGDLYATTWWVPMASSAGLASWKGGISAKAVAAGAGTAAAGSRTAVAASVGAAGKTSALELAVAASKELPRFASTAGAAAASAAAAAVSSAASRVSRLRHGDAAATHTAASSHAAAGKPQHPATPRPQPQQSAPQKAPQPSAATTHTAASSHATASTPQQRPQPQQSAPQQSSAATHTAASSHAAAGKPQQRPQPQQSAPQKAPQQSAAANAGVSKAAAAKGGVAR